MTTRDFWARQAIGFSIIVLTLATVHASPAWCAAPIGFTGGMLLKDALHVYDRRMSADPQEPTP